MFPILMAIQFNTIITRLKDKNYTRILICRLGTLYIYTKKNVHKVEMIQRRAPRWTLKYRYRNTDSVPGMLSHLRLMKVSGTTWAHVYSKMVHGPVAITISAYVPNLSRDPPAIYTHPHSIIQMLPGLEAYRMSYFTMTIVQGNSLPSEFVTARLLINLMPLGTQGRREPRVILFCGPLLC